MNNDDRQQVDSWFIVALKNLTDVDETFYSQHLDEILSEWPENQTDQIAKSIKCYEYIVETYKEYADKYVLALDMVGQDAEYPIAYTLKDYLNSVNILHSPPELFVTKKHQKIAPTLGRYYSEDLSGGESSIEGTFTYAYCTMHPDDDVFTTALRIEYFGNDGNTSIRLHQ